MSLKVSLGSPGRWPLVNHVRPVSRCHSSEFTRGHDSGGRGGRPVERRWQQGLDGLALGVQRSLRSGGRSWGRIAAPMLAKGDRDLCLSLLFCRMGSGSCGNQAFPLWTRQSALAVALLMRGSEVALGRGPLC